MKFFEPSPLEAHLIEKHHVLPQTVAAVKENRDSLNTDYERFVEANHNFMHHVGSDHSHD